ncbi:MAG TPA: hypothetical protein VG326_03200 [Tepidisphaeraceae bacterium]|jgi:hypothetical protein|nr:hypothetical protein [Tepidisphaeraceae bacterium]
MIGSVAAIASPPASATQPAATTQEIELLGPARAPTTQAATQPANSPAADPKAVAEKHQKELDERWREARRQQRAAMRERWTSAPIVQTFKPDALVHISEYDGLLSADAIDIDSVAAARVAVEGSDAIWTVSSPNRRMRLRQGFAATSYVSITRFDFDAGDSEFWQTRLMVSGANMTIFAQNLLGSATIFQSPVSIIVRITESQEVGQAPKVIFEAHVSSLKQLRSENPAEFRALVLPLLIKFADATFMQPGAADVYSAFTEIPADEKVVAAIERLAPALDSDDPNEREAASGKLSQLGKPGVLAALRFDDANLSLEQKVRLRGFVGAYRRRPWSPPALAARDVSFLIDCLEYEDPAVRAAAKSALEKQARQPIAFDISLAPPESSKAADALRKRLLAPPPPPPATTAPATRPTPQS